MDLRAKFARITLSPRNEVQALPSRPRCASATFPGERVDTARGPLHVVRSCRPLRWAFDLNPAHLSEVAKDERLRTVDRRGALYLDTETSGLAGGTGTVPFLIGMAWHDGDSLVVHQLLLRRPGEEAPMLEELAARIASGSYIVTYNGKSFDWPLLRNRFVMNRLNAPLPPPHVDLLHCARRVLRGLLPSMTLTAVERAWLRIERKDDISGCDIPERYFAYLRNGDGRLLIPIVEHNAADLTALPTLLGRLVYGYGTPSPKQTPAESLGYANLAYRARDYDKARAFAEQACNGEAEVAARALQLLARLHSRAREFCHASEKLLSALQRNPAGCHNGRIHLALAKLHEHRLRNYSKALVHARAASYAESFADHADRLRRLETKMRLPNDADFAAL